MVGRVDQNGGVTTFRPLTGPSDRGLESGKTVGEGRVLLSFSF